MAKQKRESQRTPCGRNHATCRARRCVCVPGCAHVHTRVPVCARVRMCVRVPVKEFSAKPPPPVSLIPAHEALAQSGEHCVCPTQGGIPQSQVPEARRPCESQAAVGCHGDDTPGPSRAPPSQAGSVLRAKAPARKSSFPQPHLLSVLAWRVTRDLHDLLVRRHSRTCPVHRGLPRTSGRGANPSLRAVFQ